MLSVLPAMRLMPPAVLLQQADLLTGKTGRLCLRFALSPSLVFLRGSANQTPTLDCSMTPPSELDRPA